jgi:hypothetical protein
LLQRARAGDTTCSIFYLKTQAGWRDNVAFEHEVKAEPGSARDALTEMLAQIAERGRRIGVTSDTIEHEPDHARS